MDDATTTADGFRVGRRVRVNLEGDRHHGLEGELRWIPGHDEESPWWHIKFGDKPVNPADAFHQSILLLLPEPDAPATPEPRFKAGDRVCATTQPYMGWWGTVRTVGSDRCLVDFDDRGKDWKLMTDLEKQEREPEPPADNKPGHYQALRDADCEPFKVIRGAHSRDWAIGYHVGTAEAYLLRCQHKHPTPDDDIRKAHAHLTEAVAILDGKVA